MTVIWTPMTLKILFCPLDSVVVMKYPWVSFVILDSFDVIVNSGTGLL